MYLHSSLRLNMSLFALKFIVFYFWFEMLKKEDGHCNLLLHHVRTYCKNLRIVIKILFMNSQGCSDGEIQLEEEGKSVVVGELEEVNSTEINIYCNDLFNK